VGTGDTGAGDTAGQECRSSSECQNPGFPHCHSSGFCVECASPSDCSDPAAPECGADGVCGECSQDSHCVKPGAPICDGHSRVECLSRLDCTNGTHTDCTANVCVLPCTQDAQEPNDTPGTAVLVSDDGSEYDGSLCPNDSDWFEFRTLGPTYVGVQVVFNGNEGDVDFDIEQVGGGLMETVHGRHLAYSNMVEGFHRRLPSAGTYRVRIFLHQGLGGVPYRVRFDLLPEG
jgi:hypothetical protein